MIDTLKENIDNIAYIHIADVPGRNEPGIGEVNYKNVIKALADIKYEGVIGFELAPLGGSKATVDAIMNL
ncbi:TIM barrel protein [Clostridium brassicae]|uniref:TIM barrel protein n=1 Tax=Clostridium brassicae TaxID=2999072 RepID=UPI0038991642